MRDPWTYITVETACEVISNITDLHGIIGSSKNKLCIFQ